MSVPLRRRRDRRGRGLRTPLLRSGTGNDRLDRSWRLPRRQPGGRTRAEVFDDMVLDAVELLERRWHDELATVEFTVEEVPPVPLKPAAHEQVPLSRIETNDAPGTRPHRGGRIVLYRRPLMARARDADDLAEIVLDVVIHQLADLLEVDVAVLDPEGHGDG